jgi:hypothetical protein
MIPCRTQLFNLIGIIYPKVIVAKSDVRLEITCDVDIDHGCEPILFVGKTARVEAINIKAFHADEYNINRGKPLFV